MAISSGVRQHRAWLTIDGDKKFPLLDGSVTQTKERKSATFSCNIPLGLPGAADLFASLGEHSAVISVMAGAEAKTLLEGEVDKASFDYIGGRISLTGRCKSAKLHGQKSSEKFINKKNHEIIQEVGQRVGLKVDMKPSAVESGKYVNIDWSKVTDGVSYASILHRVTEMEGARWWTSKGTLYVRGENDDDAVYSVTYKPGPPKSADFMRLTISRNIQAGKTTKVTVHSWNSRKKQAYKSTSTYGGAGGTTEYNYHVPGLSQQHAEKHAKSKCHEHSKHEICINLDCVGDPDIDVAMKLRLRGTTWFDQDYEMTNISHRFGMSGYTMTITANNPKKGRKAS